MRKSRKYKSADRRIRRRKARFGSLEEFKSRSVSYDDMIILLFGSMNPARLKPWEKRSLWIAQHNKCFMDSLQPSLPADLSL